MIHFICFALLPETPLKIYFALLHFSEWPCSRQCEGCSQAAPEAPSQRPLLWWRRLTGKALKPTTGDEQAVCCGFFFFFILCLFFFPRNSQPSPRANLNLKSQATAKPARPLCHCLTMRKKRWNIPHNVSYWHETYSGQVILAIKKLFPLLAGSLCIRGELES